jgi:hypothetical protein
LNPGTTDSFTWYDDVNGNGDPLLPELDPTTPLINGGIYYVFADNFICTSNFAQVTVVIDDPADAGGSASQEFCEDMMFTSLIDMLPLLTGMPETTGTWTGPLPTTNGSQGSVNLAGVVPAVYTFTYTITGSGACPDATSTVTFTIREVLTSGTVSAAIPAVFCDSQAPAAFDLFTLLDGEDAGGVWTAGSLPSDPVTPSTVNLAALMPGIYTYTYTQNGGTNPCPEESTTVTVQILPDPNAGMAVPTSFCENDLTVNSPYDLFLSLDGSQDNNNGTWTNAAGTVVISPIDITSFNVAGSPYLFTYTIDNGACTDS